MNWEFLTQVLDTLAFFLVTPEIIGRERLQSFRDFINRDETIVRLVFGGSLIVYIGIWAHFITTHYSSIKHPWPFFAGLVAIVVFVLFPFMLLKKYESTDVVPLLTRTTEKMATTGNLFVIGAICFLLARGIGMWLAWNPAVGAHAG